MLVRKNCSTFITITKNGRNINIKKCLEFFANWKLVNKIIFCAQSSSNYKLKNVHFTARIIIVYQLN
jgi:hypothetical protein